MLLGMVFPKICKMITPSSAVSLRRVWWWRILFWDQIEAYVNPFAPSASLLYPLKTSENRKVFWCFQVVKKGCIGNKWVNIVYVMRNIIFRKKQSWKEALLKNGNCNNNKNIVVCNLSPSAIFNFLKIDLTPSDFS